MNITRLAVNGLRLLAGKPRDTGRAARTLPRGRRRKAAVAASVGLAAFALFQLGLAVAAELSFWVRDPGYSDKEIRLARLEAAAPGAPVVLMLGTSRTGYGFHAGRVE